MDPVTAPAVPSTETAIPVPSTSAKRFDTRIGLEARILRVACYTMAALCLAASIFCSAVAITGVPATGGISTVAFIPALILAFASFALYSAGRTMDFVDDAINHPNHRRLDLPSYA